MSATGTTIFAGEERLFETSSGAFLICKIGAGIPYLAEVPRRLISICRALQKTKHQVQQSRECSQASATALDSRGWSQDLQVVVQTAQTTARD